MADFDLFSAIAGTQSVTWQVMLLTEMPQRPYDIVQFKEANYPAYQRSPLTEIVHNHLEGVDYARMLAKFEFSYNGPDNHFQSWGIAVLATFQGVDYLADIKQFTPSSNGDLTRATFSWEYELKIF